MEYLVTWTIEIDADSPLEAAQLARACQVRDGTTALVFKVEGSGPDDAHMVDLEDESVTPA